MLLVMVSLLLAPAALADNVPEPEALFSPELVGKEPGGFEGQPTMVGATPTEHNVMLGVSAEEHNIMLTSAPGYTANTDGSFSAVIAEDGEEDAEITAKILARRDAKKAKNFAEADRIRDELAAAGIEVTDIPNGAKWKRI